MMEVEKLEVAVTLTGAEYVVLTKLLGNLSRATSMEQFDMTGLEADMLAALYVQFNEGFPGRLQG